MNTSYERQTEDKATNIWLTPPEIIQALGPFDLDPCFMDKRPWETAKHYYTEKENGLIQPWFGDVWCNPPYGEETKFWLEKCAQYKNVIALVYARTETIMFFDYVWENIKGIFFLKGRQRFYTPEGEKGGSAGAPSVLLTYNESMAERLKNCNLDGKFIKLNRGE